MRDDLRFAIRVLRRFKLYTLAVTITLTLGVGATTAILSVIDATLLRPLPYPDPERLVYARIAGWLGRLVRPGRWCCCRAA